LSAKGNITGARDFDRRRRSTGCRRGRRGRSSPAASTGRLARSPSGTTGAWCATPSTTITACAAPCAAWPRGRWIRC